MRRQTAGQQPVRTGALTILLVVMSICLAALAVLSLTTAAADRKLAERSGETTRSTYALERTGQQWLAQLDALLLEIEGQDSAALPALAAQRLEGQLRWEGKTLFATLGDQGERQLQIAVELTGGETRYRVRSWQLITPWEGGGPQGGLWDGRS
ncbi:hypothetical protein [Bittarella massiliensis (ex Durand et al. 2017)]|uniref:hypothetical protein n=1 Tax=Bittarella massiliensis (ex Durand et al. 2017) TaxID=1720313 RepID=UPI001AA0BACC|nr:hypothetical protein [Bittarella massiliensis (ex Durand et al. 2017)]MBO1679939.1 hypothetical protein [Bittarella massiliensis (ex Durand et al. 2017)]